MRYFFHFLSGNDRLDDDLGIEHANVVHARAEAVRAAREMVGESLRQNLPVADDSVIEITDACGRLAGSVSLMEAAFGLRAEDRYLRVFERLPQCYLLVARDFTILHANRAYLQANSVELSAVVRRPIFEVWPDNPADPQSADARRLASSLNSVLREKTTQVMPPQRHDVRRPDGTRHVRYRTPVNIPVLDGDGEVELIVHHLDEVMGAATPERTQPD